MDTTSNFGDASGFCDAAHSGASDVTIVTVATAAAPVHA
jgi:hypothetical protein